MKKNIKVLTGIDLPFEPSCGSLILCDDIYSRFPDNYLVKFLGIVSNKMSPTWSTMKDITLFDIEKIIDTDQYKSYVDDLLDRINQEINNFNPDIIHIHHLSFGMAIAFSRTDKRIPKIAVCHGTDILYSITNEFHKKSVIEVCNASNKIIFPTTEMYNDFKRIIGIDLGDKAIVVSWGIPHISDPNSQRTISNKEAYELLYAGRITEDKGVDIILQSIKYLPNNYKLTIIGGGSHKETITKISDALGLQERVKLLDFMPRKDLWKEFNNYDAIIVSTKEIEAFCLVAIEAQAHGLPIVYSNTSGLREVVGDSGLRFIPQNSEDLADKVKILFDQNNYQEYTAKSLRNAKKFTIEKTVQEFLNLTEELL